MGIITGEEMEMEGVKIMADRGRGRPIVVGRWPIN